MGLFDSSSPSISVAVDVLFPSNVLSGPGVAVDKTSAVWSVGLDYVDLIEAPRSRRRATTTSRCRTPALSRYEKVRLDNMNLPTLVDLRTPIGDANYSASLNDRYLGLTAQLTAIRTMTLPAATTVPPAGRSCSKTRRAASRPRSTTRSCRPAPTRSTAERPSCRRRSEAGSSCARTARTPGTCSPSRSERLSPTRPTSRLRRQHHRVHVLEHGAHRHAPCRHRLPVGKRLTIVDESGACSSSFTICIRRAGADTINGAANAALTLAFAYLALESDGASKWTIVDSSAVASSQIGDATASGRALLTAPSVAAQRVLMRVDQHTNVADANYATQTTDQLVAFTAITAARTVTLPAAASVNPGNPS